jgi:hypothetical protein
LIRSGKNLLGERRFAGTHATALATGTDSALRFLRDLAKVT